MKHNFFHKAIMEAYSGLISPDAIPSYFLYFTVAPALIDINIHPTKTEIKFQNETDFFQILMAGIKEALGKFNITPPLDFDTEGSPDFTPPATASSSNTIPYVPKINYNPGYNPFNYKSGISKEDSDFEGEPSESSPVHRQEKVPANWNRLFDGLTEKEEPVQSCIPGLAVPESEEHTGNGYLQVKGRYLMGASADGIILIDQKRAHERILFEKYTDTFSSQKIAGQKSLFPETIELSASDFALIGEILPELEYLGFELEVFGKNCYAIYATPPDLSYSHAREVLAELTDYYKNTEGSIRQKAKERIALALAKASAIGYKTTLSNEDIRDIVCRLFACKHHKFTADGKPIIHTITGEEINSWFK